MGQGISEIFIKKQENHYSDDKPNRNRIATPGSQYLVQLLKGGYLGAYQDGKGRKALDMGCGAGFNIVSLKMLGWDAYGCDISEKIKNHAKQNIARFGYKADIKIGSNLAIPFPSSEFELLISINSIHYIDSKMDMKRAIKEISRVVKKGGRILLQTNHPDNWILKDGTYLSDNMVRLDCPHDFRDKELFFIFRSQKELKQYFSEYFTQIQTGVVQFEFFVKTVKNYVLTAVKK